MIETVIGGLLGGAARLVPEVLTWFDKKDERKHEAAMFDKQIEMDKVRSENAIKEIQEQGKIAFDTTGLQTLMEAVKGQAQLTGNKWVDGLNSSVRPVITYGVVILYGLTKIGMTGEFSGEDRAMLSGILNFWFLDRVIRKQQGV